MIRPTLGLALLTARTLFAGKRAWAAGVLLLLPPLLALLTASFGRELTSTQVFQNVVFNLTLWIVLHLLGAIFGIALSSGEIEDGTAGYLYLCAVPRWLAVLVRIAVAQIALAIGLAASLAFTALAASRAPGEFAHPVRDVLSCTLVGSAGLLVMLAWTVTWGFVTRTPLGATAAALVPVFFWEFMVTWWPVKFAAYTVTNNLRGLMLVLLFDGVRGQPYKYVKNFRLPTYSEAAMTLSALAGLFLAAAMVAAMNRSIEGKEAR